MSFDPMLFRRRGFVKRAPCSRATRLEWQEKQTQKGRVKDLSDIRNVFKSIFSLLAYTSGRTEAHLEKMTQLLQTLPSWLAWTPHDDHRFGSAIADLFDSPRVKMHQESSPDVKDNGQHTDWKEREDHHEKTLIEKALFEANGNCAYIDERDFQRTDHDWHAAYLIWLHTQSCPDDPDAYLQDEDGRWLRNADVRRRLQEGAVVNILTRQLSRLDPEPAAGTERSPESPPRHRIDPLLMSPSRARGRVVLERG